MSQFANVKITCVFHMPIIVSGCAYMYILVLDVWVLLGNMTWFVAAAIHTTLFRFRL